MSILNSLLRGLFDGLLYPFRQLHPVVGLAVVSLLTAVGMLLIFKRASNQPELDKVKRRIHACLFEIRLFNDDLGAILRAQLEILRHNLSYFKLSLVPMIWILPPLAFVFAQLEYHYAYRGLEAGGWALVKVELRDGWDGPAEGAGSQRPSLRLEAPPGLRVDSPAVWIPARREMAWRLSAESWGDYELQVKLGDESYTKSVRVSKGVVRRSPLRPDGGLLEQFLYPAESPLPTESTIKAIFLTYPSGDVSVFGMALPWWLVFFVLSILFAFLLKKRFGVIL